MPQKVLMMNVGSNYFELYIRYNFRAKGSCVQPQRCFFEHFEFDFAEMGTEPVYLYGPSQCFTAMDDLHMGNSCKGWDRVCIRNTTAQEIYSNITLHKHHYSRKSKGWGSTWSTPMGSLRPLGQPWCASGKPSGTNYPGKIRPVKGCDKGLHTDNSLMLGCEELQDYAERAS
ncbi:hypothetical protein HAX54_007751 [Datura stramonium]|uniref:Uncharacterized protein n=1 Tax=Datura stramonium TaxID=4076 RepID=A0ABS8RLE4_DATST|nr:hypothetical protein [Datura stramonium]